MTDLGIAVRDVVVQHRAYSHPVFAHWSKRKPSKIHVAALLHQIQLLCAATRSMGALPEALRSRGHVREADMLASIEASEREHGDQLFLLIEKVVGRSDTTDASSSLNIAGQSTPDFIKNCSDAAYSSYSGYEIAGGTLFSLRRALAVLARRHDSKSASYSLGVTLAVECLAAGHIIPGEIAALVDSGHYGVRLSDAELVYLQEHAGEGGAEAWHRSFAIDIVSEVVPESRFLETAAGAQDICDAIAALYDDLDHLLG